MEVDAVSPTVVEPVLLRVFAAQGLLFLSTADWANPPSVLGWILSDTLLATHSSSGPPVALSALGLNSFKTRMKKIQSEGTSMF
jgi:hypothetical protein